MIMGPNLPAAALPDRTPRLQGVPESDGPGRRAWPPYGTTVPYDGLPPRPPGARIIGSGDRTVLGRGMPGSGPGRRCGSDRTDSVRATSLTRR